MAKDSHRINHQIRVKEVRLVGENVENGIVSRDEAMRLADDQGLDLVEISPNAKPPVCKVIDYSKFKYEQKKREKELKAKASKTVVKEIRFGPNTDQHDLDFKTKHAVKFLNDGNKVKAYVHFHGRTIIYKDRGKELLKRFAEKIQEHGKVEGQMRVEGRRMIMFISPNVPKK
ncbi:translation initiation factor IF-3 [Flammeovirga agarivorans]|uniref:Translation initiation factor IF-3 n=1 Tax=Flammeovirga agarivorans TaxID=2726742 RepID=A0A7X8XWX5_9BACT|nr:translation initiation factor IF-3 [Flammeovirga agarivorans]NLR92686.1 translation initiation factor IF-3 [Flammeovirga agarivorans]